VRVRSFRPGEDEAAWVHVNNRAFAGHPEQGEWTVEMLRAREAEEWFDPEGFLLAFDADGLAGSCWTKVHPPRPPHEPAALGEIYVIGTDPTRHGTGLGRALTAGGLASLAARGVRTGMLYVDAANHAAVGLYTGLGFTTHRVDRARPRNQRAMTAGDSLLLAQSGSRLPAAASRCAAQLWEELYENAAAVTACRAAAAAGSGRASLPDECGRQMTSSSWECPTAGRDGSHALPRPGDGVRVIAGRMRGLRCATGQENFERHLDTGEIVEQVLRAQHGSPQRIGNVVFMGMGEPLANYEPVWGAIERFHADLDISARRVTVSTVGVVPGIRRLAAEDLPVTLAVSLHAPTDAEREALVPLNRRYPIAEVLDAAADFAGAKGRRVTFEYACIRGVNDSMAQADTLGRVLDRFPGAGGAHVNVIPLNPTGEFGGTAPAPARLQAFANRLRVHGVTATVRRNRGTDIDAACGQLRSRVAMHRVGRGSARMEP
jgi:ribosomal protein S18 acetylase RimI-like enzyme